MISCSDAALNGFNFNFFLFCIFSLLVYLVLNQKAKGWLSKNEREPTHPRVGGVVLCLELMDVQASGDRFQRVTNLISTTLK